MATKPKPGTHPERPLIEMLLSAYGNDSWQGCKLDWIEEVQENAPEVIATRKDGPTLAIEHTLVEPFVGERYDTNIFMETFAKKIEKNPDLTVPGQHLYVYVAVGAVGRGRDWETIGDNLLVWLKANGNSIPEGTSKHDVQVDRSSTKGPLTLVVSLELETLPGLNGTCGLGRSDKPDSLDRIVEKALVRKVPKLAKAQADKRLLLLQREHVTMSESAVWDEIQKRKAAVPELEQIDEIWFVNTAHQDAENFVVFTLIDKLGMVAEVLMFKDGILSRRRSYDPLAPTASPTAPSSR